MDTNSVHTNVIAYFFKYKW